MENKALQETKRKVERYYEKVGDLNINPFSIPESPSDVELHVGWAFDRIRAIVAYENSRRKFHDVNEILLLLGVAAGDMGMDVKFSYYKNIGQWMIEFGNPDDYLNLPHLIKHFGLLWRFKWRGDALAEPDPNDIDFDSVTINEGSEDIFTYDHGGCD